MADIFAAIDFTTVAASVIVIGVAVMGTRTGSLLIAWPL